MIRLDRWASDSGWGLCDRMNTLRTRIRPRNNTRIGEGTEGDRAWRTSAFGGGGVGIRYGGWFVGGLHRTKLWAGPVGLWVVVGVWINETRIVDGVDRGGRVRIPAIGRDRVGNVLSGLLMRFRRFLHLQDDLREGSHSYGGLQPWRSTTAFSSAQLRQCRGR